MSQAKWMRELLLPTEREKAVPTAANIVTFAPEKPPGHLCPFKNHEMSSLEMKLWDLTSCPWQLPPTCPFLLLIWSSWQNTFVSSPLISATMRIKHQTEAELSVFSSLCGQSQFVYYCITHASSWDRWECSGSIGWVNKWIQKGNGVTIPLGSLPSQRWVEKSHGKA